MNGQGKVLRLLIVKRNNRMDQRERKQFWEVLCSLQGNDLQSESEKLAKTIMLPRYLYRYRAVSLSTIYRPSDSTIISSSR